MTSLPLVRVTMMNDSVVSCLDVSVVPGSILIQDQSRLRSGFSFGLFPFPLKLAFFPRSPGGQRQLPSLLHLSVVPHPKRRPDKQFNA
nr:hypothetical protein [Methylobacterium sp. ZNC0032]